MTETIDLTEPISQLGIIDNDENDEFLDHLFGKQKVSWVISKNSSSMEAR